MRNADGPMTPITMLVVTVLVFTLVMASLYHALSHLVATLPVR